MSAASSQKGVLLSQCPGPVDVWLNEARLDGQKPSEVWEGVCKAGSAAGSVEGEKSSCRNFTLVVVVTLRPLVREHREKE